MCLEFWCDFTLVLHFGRISVNEFLGLSGFIMQFFVCNHAL